jgi:hypothetical protein
MDKLNDLKKYFHHFIDQLSSDHSDKADVYHVFDMIVDNENDHHLSLKWF